jgi:sarcosine oxidase
VNKTFDVIIVGLGAMGAATTYQLAKRGVKVLGIDQFTPPHTLGSSHGDTRITRLACGEGEDYTPFARRSNEIWRELERVTGATLLTQNGLLVISGRGERAATHGNANFLQTTIDAAKRHQVPHELLSDSDIRGRFPTFNIADGDRGYFEPSGGFLHPEACIAAQLGEAGKVGATLRTGETVQGFDDSGSNVTVTTTRDQYRADNLVLSAGAWLPKFIGAPLASNFTIRRQVLAWFRIDRNEPLDSYRPEAFPGFIWQLPRKQTIYGFPWVGGEPSIKIATEQYDETTTADTVNRNASTNEIRELYETYVADFFPGVTGECVKSAVCMYTCVDNARFVIDTLPGHPRVIVVSPCSGHGFKHSAAIGEAVAGLVTGKPIADLPLGRFAMPAAA